MLIIQGAGGLEVYYELLWITYLWKMGQISSSLDKHASLLHTESAQKSIVFSSVDPWMFLFSEKL
jgi:hypothetical protein